MRATNLTFNTGTVHKSACVSSEARHGTADVVVDLEDFLDTARLHKRTSEAFLAGEDAALGGRDANGSGTMLRLRQRREFRDEKAGERVGAESGKVWFCDLDGLDSIFDLDEATLRRKGVYTTVVLAPVGKKEVMAI